MRPVLFSSDLRSIEARAAASGSVSLEELMERAGSAVAEAVHLRASDGSILVVSGSGNNGGDGWVAARILRARGRDVHVASLAELQGLPEPARLAATRAIEAGVPWSRADAALVADLAREAALVVDAVLGIGVRGAIREEVASVLQAMAVCEQPVIAVDVPSGVDADTGVLLGPVPR
ncbi:MAG: NAD(P)H-hydrate epimerase, partial [Coriobacteriia bacterium]|nr:NAD(P)H-hydrate epimerase [Coriobacteriia bacterium]